MLMNGPHPPNHLIHRHTHRSNKSKDFLAAQMEGDALLKGMRAPSAARHYAAAPTESAGRPGPDAPTPSPAPSWARRTGSISGGGLDPHCPAAAASFRTAAGPPAAAAAHRPSFLHSLASIMFRGTSILQRSQSGSGRFNAVVGSPSLSARSNSFAELGDEECERPLNIVTGTAFWRRLSAGIEIICVGEMRGALLAHSALGCPGVSTLLGNLSCTMDETHTTLGKVRLWGVFEFAGWEERRQAPA
jgi:hypothetical protein